MKSLQIVVQVYTCERRGQGRGDWVGRVSDHSIVPRKFCPGQPEGLIRGSAASDRGGLALLLLCSVIGSGRGREGRVHHSLRRSIGLDPERLHLGLWTISAPCSRRPMWHIATTIFISFSVFVVFWLFAVFTNHPKIRSLKRHFVMLMKSRSRIQKRKQRWLASLLHDVWGLSLFGLKGW